MKPTIRNRIGGLTFLSALALTLQPATARAQGTAFSYQGRLDSGGAPANGIFDLQFAIFDSASGGALVAGPLTNTATAVSNGLFTVTLDFGAGVFTGPARWLEIAVRVNGGGEFTTLSPRQALTATPYAISADNVTGVLAPAALSNAWKITGNASTTPGGHFLGTTDNQPLELRVNARRALRIEPNAANAPNLIAGSAANYVSNTVVGATIGGGGAENYAGFLAYTNRVLADFGTVSGGRQNTASGESATVGGGIFNTASFPYATVGGGYGNTARESYATASGGLNGLASGFAATVAGGSDCNATGPYATVSGGIGNYATGFYSTASGGYGNTAGGQYATVPGGNQNFATNSAFAAGNRAKANHLGSFVWGDSSSADVLSAANNSVTFRASGGYRLFSNSGLTAGVSLAAGGGSWTSISDRNAKENLEPVNALEVLEKVAALPITRWNYKTQDASIRHIGPTAQDFKAAFGVGESETGITSIDADGVALAAIQGLNQKVEARSQELGVRSQESEARIQKLEAENAALQQRLTQLEQLVRTLAASQNGGAQ